MIRPPPRPKLFPYTTLFRSIARSDFSAHSRRTSSDDTGTQGNHRPKGIAGSESLAQALDPQPLPVPRSAQRSEEHTSELQSLRHLVCRLLLEKKNNNKEMVN